MHRRSATALTLSLCAPALGQPLRPADSALTDAAREGAEDMASRRLDRLAAMSDDDLHARVDAPDVAVSEPAAAPTQDTPARPFVPPPGARATWASCSLDGDVEPVDIHPGTLLAVQLSFAQHNRMVAALVTLGRPAGAQRGMSYPSSRLITWTGDRFAVFDTPGVEPDAQLAVTDTEIAVLGYARTDDELSPRPITLSRWTMDGRSSAPRIEIPNTSGMRIDSPLIAWRGGYAVVLGRPPATPDQDRRSEALYFLTPRGARAREPLELTRETRDDTLGPLRAGLTSLDDGASLTAAWTVDDGLQAGVWARRGVTLSASPRAERVSPERRGLWSPQPGPWGVLYRRAIEGQEGTPAEVMFSPWGRAPSALGAGRYWDPIMAWGAGGWITAGLVPPGVQRDPATPLVRAAPVDEPSDLPVDHLAPSPAVPEISFCSREGTRSRSVGAPRESIGAMDDAVDIAIGATDRGAIVGWIETERDDEPGATRRVVMARVVCRAR